MKKIRSVFFASFFALVLTTVLYEINLLQHLPALVSPPRIEVRGGYVRDSGKFWNLELTLGDAHFRAPRKDLDKSNYTSGDISTDDKWHFTTKQTPNRKRIFSNSGNASVNGNESMTSTKPMFANISSLYDIFPLSLLSKLNDYFFKTEKWPFTRLIGGPLPTFRNYQNLTNATNWEQFHLGIRHFSLYDPDKGYLKGLISDIHTKDIVEVVMKEGGTQLKLIITLSDEGETLFKPMRRDRSYETNPNHFYFTDFERHNAEIAAFHMDRILGFYRAPPVVGRVVNITQDLKRLADRNFAKTFFISPADNVCFTGKCSYYCDTANAFCGHPDTIEGSFAAFLPSLELAPRVTYRNPWRRSYSKKHKADWELHDDYCDSIKSLPLYNGTKRMLDLIDLSIFDFLIGNMDRHHYEVFADFGNDTFLLHLDHGRSFGRTRHDEMSILAPVRQCCLIRRSTFLKLMALHHGPFRLSDALRRSLDRDRLSPVLVEGHYDAVDRRVYKALVAVAKCVRTSKSYRSVIIDDGF